MIQDLNHLLFKQVVKRKDGSLKALFRFQSELAEEIVNCSDDYREKSAEGIRPYLSQTLKKGGSPYEKPMSAELQQAIVAAIENRLAPEDPLFPKLKRKFDKAYKALKEKAEEQIYSSKDMEFEELLKWQQKANRTFVINREPSEAKWEKDREHNSESKDLINLMLSDLLNNFKENRKDVCLALKEGRGEELTIKDSKHQYLYRFFVPNYGVAKNFWKGLLTFILEEIFLPEFPEASIDSLIEPASNLLRMFNRTPKINSHNELSQVSGFLKIYKVDEYLTAIPVVYYECSEGIASGSKAKKEHEILFTLVLSDGILHTVGKISGQELEFWKEQIYYPLNWSMQTKFNKEEISLEDVLGHILLTLDYPAISKRQDELNS